MVLFSTTGLLLHVALFRLGTTHDCAIGQAGPSIWSRLPANRGAHGCAAKRSPGPHAIARPKAGPSACDDAPISRSFRASTAIEVARYRVACDPGAGSADHDTRPLAIPAANGHDR